MNITYGYEMKIILMLQVQRYEKTARGSLFFVAAILGRQIFLKELNELLASTLILVLTFFLDVFNSGIYQYAWVISLVI